MSRTLKPAQLTTANARKKLPIGVHWHGLDAEAHVGYRKGKRSGIWLARWRNKHNGSAYRQAPIGAANDENDKPLAGKLTFYEAERQARERVKEARTDAAAQAAGPALTVEHAIQSYLAERDARDSRRQGRPVRSNAIRLLGYVSADLANTPLHRLTEADLIAWRKGLPSELKTTTKQRMANDLKAALNATLAANRSRLDPSLPLIVKHGLASDGEAEQYEPVAREGQFLSDAEVARIVSAARDVDAEEGWDGDLYRLVLTLAATGGRFSQVVRCTVGDLQFDRGRLWVPVSRKGKHKSGGRTAIPIGRDVLDALLPTTTGRPANAILLERWYFRHINTPGLTGFQWERERRAPWKVPVDMIRPWRKIRARAGVSDAVLPYSLRHSSIIRSIRAGLPLQLIGKMHDTSAQMIEAHYGAFVTSALEELAARAIIPLVPAESGRNVVRFGRETA